MMEEIPQPLVDTNETERVDGRTQERRPGLAAAVSKVLEYDNLLIEILLRLGFPTTLVRAALVCKRWYHHASDRGFLKSFRKRHPPRLLGFYIGEQQLFRSAQRFVPMLPQPLELAAVVRRVAGYNLGTYNDNISIMDCRNGSVFTRCCKGRELTHALHRPLCLDGGVPIIPPLPTLEDPIQKMSGAILSKEEGGGLSYMFVLTEWITRGINFKMSVYVLQDGAWCLRTMATSQNSKEPTASKVVLAGNKIYLAASYTFDIIVLDLTTSSLSRIPLPQEVDYRWFSSTLSRADYVSGVYLTHVHEFQLRIWLHKGDNWLLVHTICLQEMSANLRMLDHTLEDEHTGSFPYLCHVGDNAEFVFLKMRGCTLYLDVTNRTLHKVNEDQDSSYIFPFMVIWPPIFPALKDDPARNAM